MEGLTNVRGKEKKKQKEKEEKLDNCKEKDELAKKKTEEKASKACSKRQNRAKRKPFKDQEKHLISQEIQMLFQLQGLKQMKLLRMH